MEEGIGVDDLLLFFIMIKIENSEKE